MSEGKPSAKVPGDGGVPFPSRREVHGSRIPVRKPTGDSPSPVTGSFPTRQELKDTGMLPQVSAKKPPAAPRVKTPRKKPSVSTQPPTGQPPMGQPPANVPDRRSVQSQTRPQPQPNGAQLNGTQQIFAGERVRQPAQVRAKRAPRWRVALVLLLLVGLVGGAVYVAITSLSGSNPITAESLDFPGPGEGSVEVTVTAGELGSEIGQSLVDAGVVKTLKGFTKAFDANSAASTIKPGTYTLKKGMTSAGALAALLDDANRRDNAITVNAGQTVSQVSEKMVSVGGFTQEQIEQALSQTDALGLPDVAEGELEGWLSPGSYDVGKGSTASEIFSQMVAATVSDLTALGVPQDQWQVVLTKASILEREAGSVEDMPKVARVIQNRLDQPEGETRGLLQMDSTVLYGVGKSGGLPTEEDLASDSPYNTYRVVGLPPGPIASPSKAALGATVDPADGDWLYFVTINLDTGETLFTSTLEEQEANIELLRQWCAENEDRC